MPNPSRALIQELAPVASRQHGLFTRAQVLELGVPAHLVDRRVVSGEWIAVDHCVYRFAVTPESWHQRVLAACLAGPAVASHRTGVVLIGVPGFSGTAVEVTSQRHRRRKSPDVIWHESFHLDPVDITHVAGIPTTTAARTLVDLATVLDDTGLLAVCNELLRRRLTSVAETVEVLDRLGARRHGAGRVRRVLDRRAADTGGIPESPLETEFEELLRRFALPTAVRQHVVVDGGEFVARLDFAYPDLRVDLEVDGARWHSADAAQARDHRRDAHLARLGWTVLRFTAWDIRFRPEWVATEVRSVLREQASPHRRSGTHSPSVRPSPHAQRR